MVYAPWRSRLEGTIGTLSDHHGLRGGPHGFRVRGRRGRTKVALLAICAAVAFDLTRQGDFLSDHGTGDDPTTTPPRPRLAARSSRTRRQGQVAAAQPRTPPPAARQPRPDDLPLRQPRPVDGTDPPVA
jgi:hypothetical protein